MVIKEYSGEHWEILVSLVKGSDSHCVITYWAHRLGHWEDKFLNKQFLILAGLRARDFSLVKEVCFNPGKRQCCCLNQALANYSPLVKFVSLPDFVNKLLLEHSTPIHLPTVHACFQATRAQLSSWDNHTAHKAENVYYLVLWRYTLEFSSP